MAARGRSHYILGQPVEPMVSFSLSAGCTSVLERILVSIGHERSSLPNHWIERAAIEDLDEMGSDTQPTSWSILVLP